MRRPRHLSSPFEGTLTSDRRYDGCAAANRVTASLLAHDLLGKFRMSPLDRLIARLPDLELTAMRDSDSGAERLRPLAHSRLRRALFALRGLVRTREERVEPTPQVPQDDADPGPDARFDPCS